jgi:hypothetical protein
MLSIGLISRFWSFLDQFRCVKVLRFVWMTSGREFIGKGISIWSFYVPTLWVMNVTKSDLQKAFFSIEPFCPLPLGWVTYAMTLCDVNFVNFVVGTSKDLNSQLVVN